MTLAPGQVRSTPSPGATRAVIDASWIPVRYVRVEVRCAFCGGRIPPGKPGTRTGERGTRAWWNKLTSQYECLGCRTDAFRAEDARSLPERTD